ncbi:MAG: hypothetical protein GX442_21905 [Candidatus Riflebacteria bacterium]|nr:hypothetical protein [Candidatus Riflebacteria bacterium]
MNRLLCLALVALTLVAVPAVFAQEPAPAADPAAPADDQMKGLDAMVDKALEAYNNQDFKAFYADFTSTMAGITTEQAFSTMYTNMYFNKYGKYKSRELIKEETVVPANPAETPVGLLQYKAVFEKNEQVKISVNITREGDAWKLMQVQFNKIQ